MRFISRRIRFGGGLCTVAVAVSFFVMILAVSVSSGFRREIRSGITSIAGDVSVEGYASDTLPDCIRGIGKVVPVIYRTGIVKVEDNIHGVMFKGTPDMDSLRMSVSIPSELSELLGVGEGDDLVSYFVGQDVKARKFRVASVYESSVHPDNTLFVYASIEDMRRLSGQDGSEELLEVTLSQEYGTRSAIAVKTAEIGAMVYPATAVSSVEKYPQLFDWLELIDFNVLAIIVLMTIVAGFNMISGLLILLFRSVSEIGILKSMGMSDRGVSKIFVRVASRRVLTGMVVGNAAALLFCLVQDRWHLLKLNPENYFVSFVPVDINVIHILAADVIAFAAIVLLTTLPALFISKVDPARSVRAA